MKKDKKSLKDIKENLGFIPPGIMVSKKLGEDFENIIEQYHEEIWEKESPIPIKYRYFMAIATAIFEKNEKRARLEIKKAIDVGANKEELLDVIKQQIWMKGAPMLVFVAPLVKFIEKKLD